MTTLGTKVSGLGDIDFINVDDILYIISAKTGKPLTSNKTSVGRVLQLIFTQLDQTLNPKLAAKLDKLILDESALDALLLNYNNVQNVNRFTNSAIEELIGGFFADHGLEQNGVQSPYLKTNYITFHDSTVNLTSRVNAKVNTVGDRIDLPIASISANSPDLTLLPSDFQPVDLDGQAWFAFKCVAERPVHAHLVGAVQSLLRISDNTVGRVNSPIAHLVVECQEPQDWETTTTKIIATANSYTRPELVTLSADRTLNNSAPTYAELVALMQEEEPLYLIPQHGYFPEFHDNEVLFAPDYTGHRSTNWLRVPSSRMVIGEYLNGVVSNVCRMQIITTDGTVQYITNYRTPDRLFTFPEDAVWFRLCYNVHLNEEIKDQDPTTVPEISLKAVPSKYSDQGGTWVRFNHNMNTPYTFYPGYTYRIQLWCRSGIEIKLRLDDLLLEQASLTIQTNARPHLRKVLENVNS